MLMLIEVILCALNETVKISFNWLKQNFLRML